MILSQHRDVHVGKVVASITTDNFDTDLVMCERIVIRFTDNTRIVLGADWREYDCYISQQED